LLLYENHKHKPFVEDFFGPDNPGKHSQEKVAAKYCPNRQFVLFAENIIVFFLQHSSYDLRVDSAQHC
jgi:hypothetical protein